MRKNSLLIILCFLCLLFSINSYALDIKSGYQGWVSNTGEGNSGLNGNNTFTGTEFGTYYNSWASFDLSAISGGFTSAELILTLARYPLDATESYTLDIYDVTTPLSDFLGYSPGLAGYNDLMTGDQYGSVTGNNGVYSVQLSSAAIDDTNAAAGGTILLGFTNFTLNAEAIDNVDLGIYINGAERPEDSPILRLSSTPASVTEPTTLILIGSGLLGLAAFSKRLKKS